ncbi:MAG: NAD-binding protein, partial [Planctomycetes bacterium]|nr:NAD-binding protein [Planctomycetota bacterium]
MQPADFNRDLRGPVGHGTGDGIFDFDDLGIRRRVACQGREISHFLGCVLTGQNKLLPGTPAVEHYLAGRDRQSLRQTDERGRISIAGFGRFGQIVARILRARQIPFTALDSNVEQVDFVRRFGAQIYYGDAGRLDILQAAGADKARAFVLAVDKVDSSLRIAELVRTHFPDLPIYARARDRTHVHNLM